MFYVGFSAASAGPVEKLNENSTLLKFSFVISFVQTVFILALHNQFIKLTSIKGAIYNIYKYMCILYYTYKKGRGARKSPGNQVGVDLLFSAFLAMQFRFYFFFQPIYRSQGTARWESPLIALCLAYPHVETEPVRCVWKVRVESYRPLWRKRSPRSAICSALQQKSSGRQVERLITNKENEALSTFRQS